uniref:L-dopachrome isomerase n=1 Tax=Dermatophagoides pteronyssinus TaxID=6956 RepID=A0A6P6YCH8_DERPT|nr:macrophage migration inhibitory factor-like [Dermatophagoides pteronyssinus]
MPQLIIQTNLRLSQIPVDFNEKTTNLLAELQNKPSSMTLISVQPNQLITFGGTNEPCALVSIQSIGNQSVDENRQSCKKIFQHLQNELNISSKRIFINFINFDPCNVGWDGRIYEDIFADSNNRISIVENTDNDVCDNDDNDNQSTTLIEKPIDNGDGNDDGGGDNNVGDNNGGDNNVGDQLESETGEPVPESEEMTNEE